MSCDLTFDAKRLSLPSERLAFPCKFSEQSSGQAGIEGQEINSLINREFDYGFRKYTG
jgi:hypothetical protein